MRVGNRIVRGPSWLVRFGGICSAISILGISVIVTYDVVLRKLGHPTVWSSEISTYLMIAIAFLGAGDTLLAGEHFSIRSIVEFFSSKSQRIIDILKLFLCVMFIGCFVYGGFVIVSNSARFDSRSLTPLSVPLVYPQSLLVIGAVLVLIGFLILIVRRIRGN